MTTWERIKAFLCALMYENNQPSLTRVLVVVFALTFLIGTAYLMVTGKGWPHYDTFAAVTTAGGVGGQVLNKFINSKFNSPPGEIPIKNP